MIALLIAAAALRTTGSVAQEGEAAEEEPREFDQYVVEIYTQDKKLIGSGTVVSLSGLILTAKHVLFDESEGNTGLANYLAAVRIGFKDATGLKHAELIVVHPYLDLAVLKVKGGIAPAMPAMPVATSLSEIKRGLKVTVIGHRLRTGELYKARAGAVDEIDRHGHIIVGRGVDVGTSGGPMIHNGRLVGVVRATTHERSVVVPVASGLDYLRLMGVIFSEQGFGRQTDNIAILASRAQRYEQILRDIQLDVDWFALLKNAANDAGAGGPVASQLELEIGYEKRLRSQPSFDAKITITAVPIFQSESFTNLSREQREEFLRTGWLIYRDGPTSFEYIDREVGSLLRGPYDGMDMAPDDLVGIDLKATVESIIGEGYIAEPQAFDICFAVRLEKPGVRLREPIRASGVPCGNSADRGSGHGDADVASGQL